MNSERRPLRVPVAVLIIALILALAAPSLVFSGLLLLQSDNVNGQAMAYRAAQGVDLIAEGLDREFRNMSTNLSLLAASGWVETEEYGLLHASATSALAGTDTYLIAVDEDYNQMLNTRVPWGTPLAATSNPASVEKAIRERRPIVSELFAGRVAQTDVFNVVLPIISGQFQVKALILTRDAATLGRSIDTISTSASGEVPMAALIATELEPFATDQPGRLGLVGAAVTVTLATAQALGLVLHEMATNAAKYGAWSVAEGRVQVAWEQTSDGLQLVWTETGGPAPAAPTRTGFGSSLIEMMIERNLNGSVTRDFGPTGLVMTFRIRRDRACSA